MRIRMMRSAEPRPGREGGNGVAAEDGATGAGEAPATTRFSQRSFLKLAGASLGLGLAAQVVARPRVALAQNLGDPDSYLLGKLYGPSGGNPAGIMLLASRYSDTATNDAFQLWVYPPGSSTFAKAFAVKNSGTLDLASNVLANVASVNGTQMTANLDMAQNKVLNVLQVLGNPSVNTPSILVAGYQYVDLKSQQAGTLRWFGNSGSAVLSVDNAGNHTFSGQIASSNASKYVTGGVVFILASGGNFGTDAPYVYWDDVNHRLGVGGAGTWSYAAPVVQPQATVSVVAAGASEIANGAASTVLRVSGGSLGTSYPATELVLTSLGFLAGASPTTNINTSLGVRAYRTGNGGDYQTTALVLGMDVDSSARLGAALWLNANGNIGVGSAAPGIVAIDSAGIATSAHQAYYA